MPPSTGYADAEVDFGSDSESDFTLLIDLSRLPASWWSAVDTSDGTKGRAFKDDGTTELATDWIDFDDTAETGWLRVKWSGTLTGTETLRIYPPDSGNSSYAASATYGSDNAYDSNWIFYIPDGAEADRTSNGHDGTVSGATAGGATGQVGAATEYDGTDDYSDLDSTEFLQGDAEFTVMLWFKTDSFASASFQALLSLDSDQTSNLQMFVSSDGNYDDLTFGNAHNEWYKGRFDLTPAKTGVWNFAALGFDGVDANASSSYAARENGASATINSNPGIAAEGAGSRMARKVNNEIPYDGTLNEVQLHDTERSADWIDQEYAQSDDQATFWGTWTWNAAAGGDTSLIWDQARAMRPLLAR